MRTLWRRPAFAIPSIAVLALAIGASAVVLSAFEAVVLEPLPYREPDRLAMLWTEIPSREVREGRLTYTTVEALRRGTTVEDIAVFDPVSLTLTTEAVARRVSVTRASPNLFTLLGVELARGRMFSEQEARERQRLAVISDAFWQAQFARSHAAIGATLQLDGQPSTVIGVLPPSLPTDVDIWEPHTLFPDWEQRRTATGPGSWLVYARLRAGATLEAVRMEINALAGLRTVDDRRLAVVPLALQLTGARAQQTLWLLLGAVFCVLLIAITNVASLSLARSVDRQHEVAICTALGATRLRIFFDAIVESSLLTAAAGALGLAAAYAAIRVIAMLENTGLPRLADAALDARQVVGYCAVCLLTGVVVGVAPGVTTARRSRLSIAVRSATSGGAQRTRRALVVAQVALAVVLLAGAGLLLRSWWAAQSADIGFAADRVLSAQLALPSTNTEDARSSFFGAALEQIGALPGVESAAIVGDFFVGTVNAGTLTVDGDGGVLTGVPLRRDEISTDFFDVVGATLLRGRHFSNEDGADAPRVAIVNEAMARRLWPGVDPLAQRFKLGPPDAAGPWFTVVGVVGDMRRQGFETAPVAQMFEPLAQNPSRLATLLVKSSGDEPLELLGSIQAAVRLVDSRVPVYGAATLEQRLGAYLAPRRFQTSLLVAFAFAALALSAVSIYGLVQYAVAARTREIGIRVAVGARSAELVRMFMLEALKLGLVGLAVGLAGALLLGQAASGLLFGVTATDPTTLVTTAALLAVVAALACYLPARRTARLDPLAALRHD